MNQLESIFEDLGISHYLNAFVEQGFDSWETILDITESDLDALGVKLGHRRKLQRRIANHRGLAPVVSLTSPTRNSIEDGSATSRKPMQPVENKEMATPTAAPKRKYRRHPKADDKAPERPPSAYVLFSNKMREDLKDQNLSFTEIAKLVGENWQNLDRAEKTPYETQAQAAKEKYNRDMNAYKKTEDYRKYSEYLQDFRRRQTNQDKEGTKRIRLAATPRGSSTSAQSTGPSRTNSGTGSGSESQTGSEPPPTRQQRLSSITSQPDPHIPPTHQQPQTEEILWEDTGGRSRGFSSPGTLEEAVRHPRRPSTLKETTREPSNWPLAWLSAPGVASTPPVLSKSPESGLSSGTQTIAQISNSLHGSGSSKYWSGPPSLKSEQSSGSVTTLSSYPGPRTPSEASVPIQALLTTTKPDAPYGNQPAVSPSQDPPVPSQPPIPIHQHPGRPPGEHMPGGRLPYNGVFEERIAAPAARLPHRSAGFPPAHYLAPMGPSSGTSQYQKTTTGATANTPPGPALDGMSALLRASDMVGRPEE